MALPIDGNRYQAMGSLDFSCILVKIGNWILECLQSKCSVRPHCIKHFSGFRNLGLRYVWIETALSGIVSSRCDVEKRLLPARMDSLIA